MAALIFDAAATGAGIVPPGPAEAPPQIRFFFGQDAHDVRRRPICAQLGRHQPHRPVDMGEEGLEPGAQIVQAGLAVGCVEYAVLGAAAVADEANFTLTAVARQRLALGEAELPLPVGADHLDQRNILEIAELVVRLDEMIAGVDIAIVLHRERRAARLLEDAQAGALAKPGRQRAAPTRRRSRSGTLRTARASPSAASAARLPGSRSRYPAPRSG